MRWKKLSFRMRNRNRLCLPHWEILFKSDFKEVGVLRQELPSSKRRGRFEERGGMQNLRHQCMSEFGYFMKVVVRERELFVTALWVRKGGKIDQNRMNRLERKLDVRTE